MQVEQKLSKEVEKVKRLEENLMHKNTELESVKLGVKTAADSTKKAEKKVMFSKFIGISHLNTGVSVKLFTELHAISETIRACILRPNKTQNLKSLR